MDLNMEESIVGMLASSKAGHDKDSVYVIIREDGEYIYVADGKSRTVRSEEHTSELQSQR